MLRFGCCCEARCIYVCWVARCGYYCEAGCLYVCLEVNCIDSDVVVTLGAYMYAEYLNA